jgi:hypothetical protein
MGAIEIKELHIKINVDNSQKSGAGKAKKSASDKEAIIAECVEQVMEILGNKEER